MPVSIQCPQCQRKLSVPDNLVGRRVKCPSCGEGFQAAQTQPRKPPPPPPKDAISSAPTKPPPLSDYEVIDEPEYEKLRPPRRRPRDDEEDQDDRPARSRRPRDDDEDEDERPARRRRRRDEDEDDDDYNIRRRRRVRAHRGGLILTLGIISLVVWCCPLAGWIVGGIALSMASTDLAAMSSGYVDDSGQGVTTAGKICAIIGIVLSTINAIAGTILRVTDRL